MWGVDNDVPRFSDSIGEKVATLYEANKNDLLWLSKEVIVECEKDDWFVLATTTFGGSAQFYRCKRCENGNEPPVENAKLVSLIGTTIDRLTKRTVFHFCTHGGDWYWLALLEKLPAPRQEEKVEQKNQRERWNPYGLRIW